MIIDRQKFIDADCIFEKKKWISITGLCNNNCRFCLDHGRPDNFHKSVVKLRDEISDAYKNGCTKLVISGGDPTIHPDVIDLVSYGSELGYKKIQIITNGRMFASKNFTDSIIGAGLDEVTFSIHGLDSHMHDSLTQVPGSFKQVILGVRNVQKSKKNMIINSDTCITKSNYRYLPEIIKFIVEKVGITEVNLMTMVPQGNAWKYREEIMCDYEDVAPYVHKVIDYCKSKEVVLWLSRFPEEFLEDYEDYIQDSYKMVDDIRGLAKDVFENKQEPPCKGKKCNYCGIRLICDDIQNINTIDMSSMLKLDPDNFSDYDMGVYEITQQNYMDLPDDKNIILKYPDPKRKVNECERVFVNLTELRPYLEKIRKSRFKDLPPCIVDKDRIVSDKVFLKNSYYTDGKLDYVKVAEDITLRVKMKRIKCKDCVYYNECEGFYKKYFRIYGFKEIMPIK